MAHALGVTVEGELGCLGSLETMRGDKEDGHGAEGTMTREMLLTDPDQAADFVKPTQLDALAIAIGTVARRVQVLAQAHRRHPRDRPHQGDPRAHPEHAPGDARLARRCRRTCSQIIRENGGEMKETYGVPVEEIQEGIQHGVRKVNIDTDIRLAMTGAIRKFLHENPSKFDPREYLKPAMRAAKAICNARYQQFGCAGRRRESSRSRSRPSRRVMLRAS